MKNFLEFVLPDDFNLCFFVTIDGSDVKPLAAKTIDRIVALAERNKGHNCYYTPFEFSAKRRLATNASRCRAFFIDMDSGPGKYFPDIQTCVDALSDFCSQQSFPKPNAIVHSGNGIHAYWVLDEVLPAGEWLPRAEQFKMRCLTGGLHIDPAITADKARVLRLPNTINFKRGPKPVRVLYQGKRMPLAVFDAALGAPSSPALAAPPKHVVGSNIDSEIGVLSAHPPAFAARIVAECPLLKEMLAEGGAQCNEPLWRVTLLLLAFCEDGAEFVHPISSKHSGYLPDRTDAKYLKACKAKTRTGPTLCSTFEQHYTGVAPCGTCPHHGQISSPILLGNLPATPIAPPFPYEYKHGRIIRVGEERSINVCSQFELGLEQYKRVGADDLEFLVLRFPDGAERCLPMPESATYESVARRGGTRLGVSKQRVGMFNDLVTSWALELRNAGNGVIVAPDSPGWGKDWNSFVFSQFMLRKHDNGHIDKIMLHGSASLENIRAIPSLGPEGDFDVWQKHVQSIVDSGTPEAHVMMALSFAAPLAELVADPPAITALVSKQSGVGKSTLFRAANSVWFGPERGISMEDTNNYVNTIVMASRSVPIFWDEVQLQTQPGRDRDKRTGDVANVIFRTIQGLDKGRLTSGATVRDRKSNRPVVVLASNMALAEILTAYHANAPEAMAARVLQLTITQRPTGAIGSGVLDYNYGTAGEAYVRYLMQLGRDKVRAMVKKVDAAVTAHETIGPVLAGAGRMWKANFIMVLVAATLANDAKILKLNMPTIWKVLAKAVISTKQDTVRAARSITAVGRLSDIIHDFIAADEYVETEHVPRPGTGVGRVVYAGDRRMHIWLAPHWARIRANVLQQEVERLGANYGTIMEELLRLHIIASRNAKLRFHDPRRMDQTKDTRTPCFDIDRARLELELKREAE